MATAGSGVLPPLWHLPPEGSCACLSGAGGPPFFPSSLSLTFSVCPQSWGSGGLLELTLLTRLEHSGDRGLLDPQCLHQKRRTSQTFPRQPLVGLT